MPEQLKSPLADYLAELQGCIRSVGTSDDLLSVGAQEGMLYAFAPPQWCSGFHVLKMPANFKDELRSKVRGAYSAAAETPADEHPFPVGRAFAERIGYSSALLDTMPAASVDAFAGVSNIHEFAVIPEGATVLDVGCGAGLDSLIAARAAGLSGSVIGIDFSETMLERARQAAARAGVQNVAFERADAERLPIGTSSVDVALVNGIFNLNPARHAVFRELARVLRPGRVAYAAELILTGPLPPNITQSEADWFAWIAGAKEGDAFLAEFRAAGFQEAKLLRTFRNARTKSPYVLAAEVMARR